MNVSMKPVKDSRIGAGPNVSMQSAELFHERMIG